MPQQFMLRKNAKFIFYQKTLGVTRIINFNQANIHLTKYCIFVHNTRAEAVSNDIILSSTKKKCPKIGEQGIFFLSRNITATDNEVLNFGLPALPAWIPY